VCFAAYSSDGDGDDETTWLTNTCSGRKIIAILEKNPSKDPEKYAQEDIDHMRKVSVV